MRYFLSILFVLCACIVGKSQKYMVEKSYISFFSHGAIEDIAAENKKASSIFNISTSEIVFSVPITEFQFEKSLMKEHFNEKYMETDKFPKALFQGKISGFVPEENKEQQVTVSGKLSIHGITQEVTIPGIIQKKDNKLSMKSKFIVKLADYKIEIPQLLWQNIAEQVDVTVDFTFRPQ